MYLRTFIERPILSAVISISRVVVGIIGLFTLPDEQYPDIAPPTIQVSSSYFSASAETLQKSVIACLLYTSIDSELSVEELGSKMGLSRVQLYRKIKPCRR